MRVNRHGDLFIVVRGRHPESFFCFYVDDDRSCWSQKAWRAQRYGSSQEAHNAIGELKRRAHLYAARKRGSC